eukprot:GHVR01164742.1.p1 GENE.GHVR01164742.1~~GHVR01164742.1.p1  ORF type:complete len:120 (-),score=1.87 GHVR01164742.1:3120-3479(-)
MSTIRRCPSKQSLNKSHNQTKIKKNSVDLKSKSKSRPKSKQNSKEKLPKSYNDHNMHSQLLKKPDGHTKIVKKKIEDLKTPDLLIKINYKSKRISIPIPNVDDKGLSETIMPHISRFEK